MANRLFNSMLGANSPRAYSKMLVLGNSLTNYTPDNVLWWGSWGMAASTQATDFVHVLQDLMATNSPAMTVDPRYCYTWEANHNNSFDYTYFDSMLAGDPDIILIRLGENVSVLTNYQANFETLINYCKAACPSARIFVTGLFWENTAKDEAQEAAANACNVEFIPLASIDSTANRSFIGAEVQGDDDLTHTVDNGAVAAHPDDDGMAAIAQRCYEFIYDDFNESMASGYLIDTGRTSGGVINGYNEETGLVVFGSAVGAAMTVNTSLIASPPTVAIWNTNHYDPSTWTFPYLARNRDYTVEIFTTENYYSSAGQRTFSVSANGVSKITNYDAWVQGGNAQNVGTSATFTANSGTLGTLTLELTTANGGQIMGIRIT